MINLNLFLIPIIFLGLFQFSPIGRIPETIQISLREAFQLKYRCQPKDNPSEFRTYLLAQANCDEELKIALEC